MRSQMSLVAVLLLVLCAVSSTRAQQTQCANSSDVISSGDIQSLANSLAANSTEFNLTANSTASFILGSAAFCATNFGNDSSSVSANDIATAALTVDQVCCTSSQCMGGFFALDGTFNSTPPATVLLAIFGNVTECSFTS